MEENRRFDQEQAARWRKEGVKAKANNTSVSAVPYAVYCILSLALCMCICVCACVRLSEISRPPALLFRCPTTRYH